MKREGFVQCVCFHFYQISLPSPPLPSPSPSLPLVTERIHSPFQPKQSPSNMCVLLWTLYCVWNKTFIIIILLLLSQWNNSIRVTNSQMFDFHTIASSFFFTNHGYIRCVALELTLSWNTIYESCLGTYSTSKIMPQYMPKLKLQCCVIYTSNLWMTKMYIIWWFWRRNCPTE